MSGEDVLGHGEKACLVRFFVTSNLYGPRKRSSSDQNISFFLDTSEVSELSAMDPWTPGSHE